jgi:hypothetical protein
VLPKRGDATACYQRLEVEALAPGEGAIAQLARRRQQRGLLGVWTIADSIMVALGASGFWTMLPDYNEQAMEETGEEHRGPWCEPGHRAYDLPTIS